MPEPAPRQREDSPAALDADFESDLLIALNAAEELSRDAALRLARRPGGWLNEPDQEAALAAAGVGASALAAARRLASDAPGVAARERRRAERSGGRIVTRLDPEYPARLSDLELPPPVLYSMGELPRAPAVAIVGSRRADSYGLEIAESFAAELAAAGLVVVSGFAVGVDGAAHRGAIEAGGATVAVLGCGLDVAYPRSHRKLRGAVAESGALISEFRMGTHPAPQNFPVRNRIIAALAVGTLVVRAAPRSGSLITARQSLELGRLVWAVPGNIFDQRSIGANSLIRDGAQPVQHPTEILEALPTRVQDRLVTVAGAGDSDEPLSPAIPDPGCRQVLSLVPRGDLVSQDELATESGLPIDQVVSHLLTLELEGWVRRYPGPAYCRRR